VYVNLPVSIHYLDDGLHISPASDTCCGVENA